MAKSYVQEYAPPKSIDTEKAAARFKTALLVIRQIFGLHRDKVFIKVRPTKGQQQYEKLNQRNKYLEVQEGKARLLVNFNRLFRYRLILDHRPIRQKN